MIKCLKKCLFKCFTSGHGQKYAFGCLTTISKIKIKVKKALWKKMDDNIILKWYGSKPVRREWNEIIQSLLYNSYKITINCALVCVCVREGSG